MEFASMGDSKAMGNIPLKFLPSQLSGLKLWTRFNTGITVTGSGVSQWDDQSGNGNHLKQATDTNRPSKESDGSILFDGVDNYLKADTFTLNQPETVYFLGKQIAWTDTDYLFDGNTLGSGAVLQFSVTPKVYLYAGTITAGNTNLTIGDYSIISAIFNGASSTLKINNSSETTGDAGANNMSGFTLGSRGDAASSFGNIQAKEIIVFNEAHDAATRQRMINYLAQVGGLSI